MSKNDYYEHEMDFQGQGVLSTTAADNGPLLVKDTSAAVKQDHIVTGFDQITGRGAAHIGFGRPRAENCQFHVWVSGGGVAPGAPSFRAASRPP